MWVLSISATYMYLYIVFYTQSSSNLTVIDYCCYQVDDSFSSYTVSVYIIQITKSTQMVM